MSGDGVISGPVRELLRTEVDSFEKIEVLAAIRNAPHLSVSLGDLTKILQLNPAAVHAVVAQLERAGILERTSEPPGHVQLSAISPLAPLVDQLLAMYGTDRIAVVTALSQVAMEKIRGMAARVFADAFILRKPKDNGDG